MDEDALRDALDFTHEGNWQAALDAVLWAEPSAEAAPEAKEEHRLLVRDADLAVQGNRVYRALLRAKLRRLLGEE